MWRQWKKIDDVIIWSYSVICIVVIRRRDFILFDVLCMTNLGVKETFFRIPVFGLIPRLATLWSVTGYTPLHYQSSTHPRAPGDASLRLITSVSTFTTPPHPFAKLRFNQPMKSLPMSVADLRSYNIFFGDFTHTLFVLQAMSRMRKVIILGYMSSNWGG